MQSARKTSDYEPNYLLIYSIYGAKYGRGIAELRQAQLAFIAVCLLHSWRARIRVDPARGHISSTSLPLLIFNLSEQLH